MKLFRFLRWLPEMFRTLYKQQYGGYYYLRDSPNEFLKFLLERNMKETDSEAIVVYRQEAENEMARRKSRGDWVE